MWNKRQKQSEVVFEEGVKRKIIGLARSFVRRVDAYGAASIPEQDFLFVKKALAPYMAVSCNMVETLVSELTYTGLIVPESQKRQHQYKRQRQIIQLRKPDFRSKPLVPANGTSSQAKREQRQFGWW